MVGTKNNETYPLPDSNAAHGASAQAFSLAAPLYDTEQAGNTVARWSRARSIGVLDRTFASGEQVMELGCGTGDEALHLARRGIRVIATDAAPGMIEAVRDKLERADVTIRRRITTVKIPAARVGELVAVYGKHSLDGAYSSFGPLNCERDLAPVAQALATLVKPGGRLVLSLINRYCAWETLWYLAARQPRKAFRRWSGHTLATVYGGWQEIRIPVYYWSPAQIASTFNRDFRVVRRMALPWLLPPQYLDSIFRGRSHLFRLVERVERLFAATWPLYTLGDHILLELVRRPIAETQSSGFKDQITRAALNPEL